MTEQEGRNYQAWLEAVRTAANLVSLVGFNTQTLDGITYHGQCPWCGEGGLDKPKGFVINTKRKFYHCFACKKGGDCFKFIQERDGVDFIRAANTVSYFSGLPTPDYHQYAVGPETPKDAL